MNPLGTVAAPKVAPGAKFEGGGGGYPLLVRAGLYIRRVRQRRQVRPVSRKWRAEPSHMASVAPPTRIWDDSPHNSRTVCRRSSRVRAPSPLRKYRLAIPEGGCYVIGSFADFCIFLDPIGGALRFCSKPSTFGQKIFFAQTAMSSNSSAPEVYQKISF